MSTQKLVTESVESFSAEEAFARHLEVMASEAERFGSDESSFLRMLKEYGAVATVKKLVSTGEIQPGFKRMVSLGRPDLTVEHAMTLPRFRHLFSKEYLVAARWRLRMAQKS